MNFKESLTYGQQIENDVLARIQSKYPCAVRIKGKWSGYDIWIPELSQSVEVKADQKSLTTGNVVVEVEMFGKPSGLLTTTADWWIVFTGLKYYWINPNKLLQKIILRNKPYVSFVGKGDTVSKKAYLIPLVEFEKWVDKIEV